MAAEFHLDNDSLEMFNCFFIQLLFKNLITSFHFQRTPNNYMAPDFRGVATTLLRLCFALPCFVRVDDNTQATGSFQFSFTDFVAQVHHPPSLLRLSLFRRPSPAYWHAQVRWLRTIPASKNCCAFMFPRKETFSCSFDQTPFLQKAGVSHVSFSSCYLFLFLFSLYPLIGFLNDKVTFS